MWTYRNRIIKSLEDLPRGKFAGFVYVITYNNGMKYIGRKAFFHKKTRKPLKGKRRKRISYVESDWISYQGSCKRIQKELKSGQIFAVDKKIIKLCKNKKELSYYETRELFLNRVLEVPGFYNENILGKFFRIK